MQALIDIKNSTRMLKKESKKLLNDNGYSLKKETGSLV
ncbi:MAG: hypothetical protein ACJA0X_002905, partial [Cyclobacteriaceae bacterium]